METLELMLHEKELLTIAIQTQLNSYRDMLPQLRNEDAWTGVRNAIEALECIAYRLNKKGEQ